MKTVGADLYIRPTVPSCKTVTALRHLVLIPISEMNEWMGLLKKYRHRMNLTACAIKFMKMVGADLYIRPTVPSCKTVTALRHLVLIPINEMNEWGC